MVCIAIMLLYPFAVPIFYALFLVAHVRKNADYEQKFHQLAVLTATIRTCFEDPFQALINIQMFSTKIIPLPWNSHSTFCDSIGNCLDLGSVITLFSLALSLVSMLKGTLESTQSSDMLGFGTCILINLLFRILSYSLINNCVHEYIIILFLILLFVNWMSLKVLKKENIGTGI